ncbi:MFS transporter, partial [Chloroflexota bacterium]
QMLPMFTEDILKVGASGLGLMMSISGLGAMLGSLTLASLPSRKRGIVFLLSGLIMGLALVSFSLSHWWYLSLFLMIVFGLARTGKITLENTLVQSYADINYRGRALSLLTMQTSFFQFGTFLAGILAEAAGVQWSIGGLATALAIISIAMYIFTPQLRNLE